MTNSFDRLLRDALEPPPPDGGGSCFDAETVAAWCEGSLDATARAAAEAHAAGCARCQALMAAMMRTEPAVPPRPWWRSPAFGWLAPLTVAAAAVLIWVGVPQRDVPMSSVASTPPPQPSIPDSDRAARAQESRRQSAPEPPASPVTRPSQARASESVDARVRSDANAIPAPRVPIEALTERVGTPVVITAPAEAQAAAGPPPPAMADAARVQTSSRPAAAAAPLPQSQPAPAPPAHSEKVAGGLAETVARSAFAKRDAQQQPEILVRSPDRFMRWRIAAPGVVQRTTNNGATWDAQRTGEPAILTAGSAPSNTVCWLVGKGGVVLLSTDGRTWRRVPFPQPLDLGAVNASDDKTATVTTVDGQTFTTTDSGKSWK